ncbi:hypothetical protein [Microbacterium sp. H1-D42]|uniref:hypothetical protein n=1 Tax=Microbacterium sp. H1-D42 TaxID=2925844 RepID=UPI001F5394DD|nr:hypothetical protein [Microbacterium sp. H1-D42]UNK71235.1 hypothetical protein MNR00_01935 [Microbacterium sp. H1-D42]
MMSTKRVAMIGVAVVTAYAALAAVQILVLNPLAAVPGAQLGAIYAEMAAAGETMPVVQTLVFLALGVVIAVVVAVLSIRSRLDALVTALLFCIVLALGVPAYFVASFGPGMNLADTFAISGADGSPWAAPLYIVSLLASGAIVGLAVRLARRPSPAAATV